MSITLGVYGATDATGWTNFGTAPASGSGNIRYVSTADGSDSNDGTTTTPGANGPFQTIMAAVTWLNAQSNNTGYWILLKMGEDFLSQLWGPLSSYATSGSDLRISGTSGSFDGTWWGDSTTYSGDPVLFSSYDPAYPVGTYGPNPSQSSLARPRITPYFNNNLWQWFSSGGSRVAIVGLHAYYSIRDPNNSTVAQTYSSTQADTSPTTCVNVAVNSRDFVLVEDCKISYACNGIGYATNSAVTNGVTRRCQIEDSYFWDASSSSGLIADGASKILIEENLFDHNGWTEYRSSADGAFLPDIVDRGFHHNIYLQDGNGTPCIVRGNIIARDASKSALRTPMQFYDNLLVQNAGGWQIANAVDNSYTANHYNNVVIESGGNGFTAPWEINAFSNYNGNITNLGTTNVYSNIYTQATIAPSNQILLWDSANNITIHDEIFYHIGTGSSNQIVLTNGSVLTATITNGGSGGVAGPTTYQDVALTGGTGTGAKADITVSGGAVVAPFTISAPLVDVGDPGDDTLGGANYLVGDVLSCAAANIGGGISGHSFTVATVSSNSQSNNTLDIYPSTGSYPDPSRTIGGYAGTLGLTATTAAFLTAARGNRKQNWNTDYTASAANSYIRAGFIGAQLITALLYRLRLWT